MSNINDGGPAFPALSEWKAPQGMSLRDHFAGLAMQAAATNPKGADGFTFEQRAEWAYAQADAMVAERARRQA